MRGDVRFLNKVAGSSQILQQPFQHSVKKQKHEEPFPFWKQGDNNPVLAHSQLYVKERLDWWRKQSRLEGFWPPGAVHCLSQRQQVAFPGMGMVKERHAFKSRSVPSPAACIYAEGAPRVPLEQGGLPLAPPYGIPHVAAILYILQNAVLECSAFDIFYLPLFERYSLSGSLPKYPATGVSDEPGQSQGPRI